MVCWGLTNLRPIHHVLRRFHKLFNIAFLLFADGPRNVSCTPDSRSVDVELHTYTHIQCTADCNPSCSYRWMTRGGFKCDLFRYDPDPSYMNSRTYWYYFGTYTHSFQNFTNLFADETIDGILSLNISDQYGAKLVDFQLRIYRKYISDLFIKWTFWMYPPIKIVLLHKFSFCYDSNVYDFHLFFRGIYLHTCTCNI